MDFDDGVRRTVKLRGNPQSSSGSQDRILVNELVVARLARLFGAPVPDGDVVAIAPEIVDWVKREVPELTNASPGAAFGRIWIEGVLSPSAETCRSARNRGDLARLVVLYTWTRNTDGKPEHLISKSTPGGAVDILGYDHGHCFDHSWGPDVDGKAGSMTPVAFEPLSTVITSEDLAGALQAVAAVDDLAILGTVSGVPAEWAVPEDEMNALGRYLVTSRAALDGVLTPILGG